MLLNQISNLNPIKQFREKSNTTSKNNVEMAEKAMVLLYVVNKMLMDMFDKKYYYYIMDVSSICNMMKIVEPFNSSCENLSSALIFLDSCKLIYFFPCAKKFNVSDEACKQYRLNSWGREYVENIATVQNKNFIDQCNYSLKKYFLENYEQYFQLANILIQPITLSSAREIQLLNKGLDIKLLS